MSLRGCRHLVLDLYRRGFDKEATRQHLLSLGAKKKSVKLLLHQWPPVRAESPLPDQDMNALPRDGGCDHSTRRPAKIARVASEMEEAITESAREAALNEGASPFDAAVSAGEALDAYRALKCAVEQCPLS